jgi:NAD(P)-dependent dehydrogenase (short-subunit alcohol dehydrogenase family)
LKKIVITGATGLLGQSLIEVGQEKNFFIVAQYHKKKPQNRPNCRWLQAEFSDLASVNTFLRKNRVDLSGCHYLINNYGPISIKPIPELKSTDLCHDFFHNTLTVFEMVQFMIHDGSLESVVNIGFENIDKMMAFQDVLPYAIAKNALLLITKSFARYHQGIRFNMVSPVTLTGAKEKLKNGRQVSPRLVAEKIYDIITGNESGLNVTIP